MPVRLGPRCFSFGGSGIVLSPTRAKYSSVLCHSERKMPVRLGPRNLSLPLTLLRRLPGRYSFAGSGIVLNPTRARYSSACNKSVPARSMILSRLSIEETSSSCSVRNHCRKLIVI